MCVNSCFTFIYKLHLEGNVLKEQLTFDVSLSRMWAVNGTALMKVDRLEHGAFRHERVTLKKKSEGLAP